MIDIKTFFAAIKRNEIKFGGFAAFYISAAIVTTVCGIFVEKLTGDISQAAVEFDVDVILQFIAAMAVVTVIKVLSVVLTSYFSGRFTGKATYKIRENFAKHFLRIPYLDFEKKNSGAMLSLYSNDLPQAAAFLTTGVPGFVSDVVSIIAAIVFMLTISPLYTLIYFAMFPVLIFLQIKISVPIQKKSIKISEEQAKFNAVVNDSLQNTSTIVAYSLEEAMETRYLSAYDRFLAVTMDYIYSLVKLVMSGIIATMLPMLFISAAAGYGVIENSISIGQYVAFISIASIAANWLTMLSQRLAGVQASAARTARINDNMTEAHEDVTSGAETLEDSSAAISFDNVTFSYGEGGDVLSGVSFEIPKGAKVAVVGTSGSGKSTLLKLVLALYDAREGNVYISGENIKSLSKSALRSNIAYVPQDSFMFPGSIRENIVCTRQFASGSHEVSAEKLEKACADAGILSFIKSLPNGFETVLSESAENISGGQRQRIALARAFFQDASVVLFDEATSALDPVTEADVLQAFTALMQGRTAIVVAHRFQAISACDTVMVMDSGKIAGMGTHSELLKNNRIYAELYRSRLAEGLEGGAANA